MNVLDNYNIAWKGLSNGSHHFEFEIDDRFFEAFEGLEIKGGKLAAEVELAKSATMLQLEVVIKGSVKVECDRCLDELQLPVDYDGKLKVKFSDEIAEYDGEVMWVNPADGVLNLAQYIYESIVLSLPYQRVHPEDADGKSLCDADMLARFGIVSPEEFDAMEADEELPLGDNPQMEKLRELKDKL